MQRSLLCALLVPLAAHMGCGAASTPAPIPEATLHHVEVLGSTMAYREAGTGPTVVFLHGNPSSSHVWRGVIPHVADRARCLAPDLIGMGASDKPEIPYRFSDHARYLDAWLDSVTAGPLVLVGYDWGGSLAMDWAARNPSRTLGLVVFETFLRPLEWSEWSPRGRELFRALRSPGVGEEMVLEQNQFLLRSLENGVARRLGEEDRAAWLAPYPTPVSRRPLLQWPREIPVEGEPADVVDIVRRYDDWLATSAHTPKLLLTFDLPAGLHPSPTGSAAMIEWAKEHVTALEVVALGPAGHHATEDRPDEIGRAIAAWLERSVRAGRD